LADYSCHRATRIQDTSGTPESLLHVLQFGLVALPTVLALTVQINAGFFLLAALAVLCHHIVAYIDIRFANQTRRVIPIEQMVHSFLELLPISAFLLLTVLHWDQFIALFGLGTGTPAFGVHLKAHPLPTRYLLSAIGAAFLLNAVPYLEELHRCWTSGKWKVGS
jgi:hypothetical protein